MIFIRIFVINIVKMTSLTNLCYISIAQTIEEAPPMIQEMIVQETSKYMEKKAIKRAKPKAEKKALKKAERLFTENLPDLISEILSDLMRLMVSPTGEHIDYYSKYSKLPRHVVRCAIRTAEETARTLDNIEVTAFRLYGRQLCRQCGSCSNPVNMEIGYSSDEEYY